MSLLRSLVAAAAIFAAAGAANARSIVVALDGTKLVRVPGAAASVAVGNPMIAGVSMDSNKTAFITGRMWGQTNLIVLDANGRQILTAPISVSSENAQSVSVYRGAERLSFACANTCERTLTPGDDHPEFRDLNEQASARTNRVKELEGNQ